jgi:hypothetical protein
MNIHKMAALVLLTWATANAQAQVVNGDFGTGLTHWNPLGDVIVTLDSPPRTVTLSTAATVESGNLSGRSAVDINALEPAAGVATYGLDLGEQAAYEGSLITQTFAVAAGQTLSFQWSFITNETTFLDHAFVAFNGQVTTLASRASPGLPTQTFSRTFTQSGPVKFTIGIVDTGDFEVVSYLSVKNIQITAVPEPSTWLLMAAGVGLLAWRRRLA